MPGVFDGPLDAELAREFLSDARHHLVAAVDAGRVVGIVSGVHYVHPDKAPELWINEAGVAPTHRERGLGKRMLEAMLAHGARQGCRSAWVLTDKSNQAANHLYSSVGGVKDDGETRMYEFRLGGQA